MPGYDDYDQDEYGQEQNGPKALREALKKAQEDLKKATDEIASLKEEKAGLESKVKSSTLRDAFADAGLDPKYARFAERDEVEPSKEAVEKWRDENKDVYAFLAKPAGDGGPEEAEQVFEDEVPQELRDAVAQGQSLESTGHPSGSSNIIQSIEGIDTTKIGDRDELVAQLARLGVPLE